MTRKPPQKAQEIRVVQKTGKTGPDAEARLLDGLLQLIEIGQAAEAKDASDKRTYRPRIAGKTG